MAEVIQASTTPTKSSKLPKLHRRTWLTIGIIVVVLIGVIVYSIAARKPSNYFKYNQLSKYSQTDGLGGAGFSFVKPVELSNKSARTTLSVNFYHDTQDRALASFIGAAVTPLNQPLFASDLAGYKRVLANPSDKNYKTLSSSITNYAKSNTQKGSTLNFADAKVFTGQYIKSNAWIYSYNGTTPAKNVKKITGEMIFAIGNKGYYYLDLYTPDANWKSNQKVWDQVVNSFAIDQ